MDNTKLLKLKEDLEDQLFNSVIPFWEKYSIDKVNGGNYNCIDCDGKIYDTTKYMWLQGRLIWMFCKLFNSHEKKTSWLRIAESGINFMQKFAVRSDKRVFFTLTENGLPIYLQRKIFSECFYTISLSEYARAINSDEYLNEARQMAENIWDLSRDPSLVGRPKYDGENNFETLAVPMILLNVFDEVYGEDFSIILDRVNICINAVRKHFVNGIMYENVLDDGTIDNSSQGCLVIPGHAIEAGWFLKHWSRKLDDADLNTFANEIITQSLDHGWDDEFGGLFYMLDSRGCSPVQLEWNMKLWWPHCEAMYATLLVYEDTRNNSDFLNFIKVVEYTLSKFPDREYGEWFGYLSREGKITHKFKGGPYKGFFHIPRALLLTINLLNKILAER
jgi:N-acylglucosamine 2-epimerase